MKHVGFGILGGIAALWLFLTVFDIQHRDYVETNAVIERDKASFDRDFEKARTGTVSQETEQRLAQADGDLKKLRAEDEARAKQLAAEREKLRNRAGDVLDVREPPSPSSTPASTSNAH